MLQEKQHQAKNLYFQTDLTKSQIAELLGVSRRSLHYWIRVNNWDRLKKSANHLPAMMAENCYLVLDKFTRHLLTEDRIMRPCTRHEADVMYKLALTIKKLKNHSTLNESMEMFAHLMERVGKKSPALADQIAPFIEEYVEEWAGIGLNQFRPDNMSDLGLYPIPAESHLAHSEDYKQANTESRLDMEDIMAWDDERNPPQMVDIEQFRGMQDPPHDHHAGTSVYEARGNKDAANTDPETNDPVQENISGDVMVSLPNHMENSTNHVPPVIEPVPTDSGSSSSHVPNHERAWFETPDLTADEVAHRKSLLDYGDKLAEKIYPQRPAA